MKVAYTDVLVIGGGLAGLRLGIGAKRRGHDVVILSLVPPKRSHSAAAQGGMQASLANVIKGKDDNEDVHFEDTVRGSDWGADQQVVRMFVNTAPKAARELAAWGVPWSRVRKGDREVVINGQKVTITERYEAHGLIAQRDRKLSRLEERMDPDLAEKIYELDRCIECGCCVGACGTARMREDFVGAVGLNRVARFRLDPRDARTDADFYDVIGDDDGVFGCMSLLGCHDVCPKELPLETQIGFLRRKMVRMGFLQGGATGA